MLLQGAWPQNGLDMAVLGLPSLWAWTKCVCYLIKLSFTIISVWMDTKHWLMILSFIFFFFQDDNYGAEEVENLKSLVSNLRQLLDLHKKYNCRLSLSVFEKVWLLLITSPVYDWTSSSHLYLKWYELVWSVSADKELWSDVSLIIFWLSNREVYEVLRSSCWTKCLLQSWLQPQWRTVSSHTLKSTTSLLMSCFFSISR